jgi:enoyl-CoA hydratase/carnithine racemase
MSTEGAEAAVTEPVVKYETRGRKCYITINRPTAMNALSTQVRDELAECLDRFNADANLLVAILTGEGGRAFSAGADLKELSNTQLAEADRGPKVKSAYPKVARRGHMSGFDDVEFSPKPLIAAVDGYCLAGGFEVALLCDIRLATSKSVFGLPEPRRSLLAGPGLINLSRMIPLGEALRMQLTGTPISAERAYQLGLICEVTEDRETLLERADAIADEILQCAPLAVQYIKRIVRDGRDLPIDAQWRFSEMFSAALGETEDALEGPRAFAEKRLPDWKMR